VNATIHQIDECVALADVDALARVYYRTLATLLHGR
jgi:acetylornithine deacetylase/succinyl-diaminopimelate desuccinylase-like protein